MLEKKLFTQSAIQKGKLCLIEELDINWKHLDVTYEKMVFNVLIFYVPKKL